MKQLLLVLILISSFFGYSQSQHDIYSALQTGQLEHLNKIEGQLIGVKRSTDQNAYLGAIQMRISEFLKTPSEKLTKFKEGRLLLENCISAHPNSIEYRFLRLIIQENAPKMLKYNKNIEEDATLIKTNYFKESTILRKIIRDYANHSNALNL